MKEFKNNELKMPASYMSLNEDEMVYVEGGAVISSLLYALGRMCRSMHVNTYQDTAEKLTESHGAVVAVNDGVYTYADGYSYTVRQGFSLSYTIGDFFYGLGDIFHVFGL